MVQAFIRYKLNSCQSRGEVYLAEYGACNRQDHYRKTHRPISVGNHVQVQQQVVRLAAKGDRGRCQEHDRGTEHGRRTFQQEEQSIDDILIADDKETLKMAILTSLNDMEHEYETTYIKAALIRSHHLEPHISFSVFLRAISTFSDREYKYDPAQRVDTVIYREEKEFMTSKSSKWQRVRRIVSYLVEIFDAIQ